MDIENYFTDLRLELGQKGLKLGVSTQECMRCGHNQIVGKIKLKSALLTLLLIPPSILFIHFQELLTCRSIIPVM